MNARAPRRDHYIRHGGKTLRVCLAVREAALQARRDGDVPDVPGMQAAAQAALVRLRVVIAAAWVRA
jgi:hypothetical protein